MIVTTCIIIKQARSFDNFFLSCINLFLVDKDAFNDFHTVYGLLNRHCLIRTSSDKLISLQGAQFIFVKDQKSLTNMDSLANEETDRGTTSTTICSQSFGRGCPISYFYCFQMKAYCHNCQTWPLLFMNKKEMELSNNLCMVSNVCQPNISSINFRNLMCHSCFCHCISSYTRMTQSILTT